MDPASMAAIASALMTAGGMYAGQKAKTAQEMQNAYQTEAQMGMAGEKERAAQQQGALGGVIDSYRQMLLG
jgi:hypothetical protein